MELDDIKEMNIRPLEKICIGYETRDGQHERKDGWFLGVYETPEWIRGTPAEYRRYTSATPPFVRIAHSMTQEGIARDTRQYRPSEIDYLIRQDNKP